MYFLWFLPAIQLAVSLFALSRYIQTKNREFCASRRSIYIIPASPCTKGSASLDLLESDLRLAEAA
jgi:hypothetical protein